jgi:hypothetical protein
VVSGRESEIEERGGRGVNLVLVAVVMLGGSSATFGSLRLAGSPTMITSKLWPEDLATIKASGASATCG